MGGGANTGQTVEVNGTPVGSGQATGDTDTSTTSSNPGGVTDAYSDSGPGPTTAPTPLGQTATPGNILADLTAPTGKMTSSLGADLEDEDFNPTPDQAGTAVASLSLLVKLAAGLAGLVNAARYSGLYGGLTAASSLSGADAKLLEQVAKDAGLSSSAVTALVSLTGHPTQSDRQTANAVLQDKTAVKGLYGALWSSITDKLSTLGVDLPKDDKTAPTIANMMTKLNSLGTIPLEQSAKDALAGQGYDMSGVMNVRNLVEGHDASEFSMAKPAVTTYTTGANLWGQFVDNWNKNATQANGQSYRQTIMSDLVASGLLDLTNGNPTTDQVATAYQSLMSSALQNNNGSIAQAVNSLSGGYNPTTNPEGTPTVEGAEGEEPVSNVNIDQAYVMHIAEDVLGPGAITANQAQTLANVANKAGDSTAAEDELWSAVANLYNPNNPTTEGSSYAAVAYNAIQDELAQYGIPSTPSLIAKLVGQTGTTPGGESVLQSAVDTPYQTEELAQAAAEGYAKAQLSSLYGPQVAALAMAGQTVASQAAPYLSTASNLLGVPTSEMNITDPNGMWMKWTQGGTGAGGTMTQQQWASYLMQNPTYGYQYSQTAKSQLAQGANGILQLFGKLPSSNPLSGVGVASDLSGG